MTVEKHIIDELVEKAGGKFQLTVLIQKRIRELIRMSSKLSERDNKNLVNMVIQEILDGKLELVPGVVPSLKKREEKE